MGALFELLLQLIFEVVGEFLVEFLFERGASGLAKALQRRQGRWAIGLLAGFGFGCAWGAHLTGDPHYPRLLWVSLAFGVVAAIGALRRRSLAGGRRESLPQADVDGLAVPARQDVQPCRARVRIALRAWDRNRLVGLVCINAGLALGVVPVFRRG